MTGAGSAGTAVLAAGLIGGLAAGPAAGETAAEQCTALNEAIFMSGAEVDALFSPRQLEGGPSAVYETDHRMPGYPTCTMHRNASNGDATLHCEREFENLVDAALHVNGAMACLAEIASEITQEWRWAGETYFPTKVAADVLLEDDRNRLTPSDGARVHAQVEMPFPWRSDVRLLIRWDRG